MVCGGVKAGGSVEVGLGTARQAIFGILVMVEDRAGQRAGVSGVGKTRGEVASVQWW